MAILLNDNISTLAPKPTDNRYGPYATLAAAKTALVSGVRYTGLVVGVITGGAVTEYWFANGITDADLVAKSGGGGGATYTSQTTYFQSDGVETHFSPVTGLTSIDTMLCLVVVGGVVQEATTSYTLSLDDGGTLIFDEAPPLLSNIMIKIV